MGSVILASRHHGDESRPLEAILRFSRMNLPEAPRDLEAEWKLRQVPSDAATRIRSPIPGGTELGVGMLDRLDVEEVGRGGGRFEPDAIGQWRDADGFGEPFRNTLIEDRAPRR